MPQSGLIAPETVGLHAQNTPRDWSALLSSVETAADRLAAAERRILEVEAYSTGVAKRTAQELLRVEARLQGAETRAEDAERRARFAEERALTAENRLTEAQYWLAKLEKVIQQRLVPQSSGGARKVILAQSAA